MGLHRTVRDGQPESASALPPRIEWIKDAWKVCRFDSGTVVDDPNPNRMAQGNL